MKRYKLVISFPDGVINRGTCSAASLFDAQCIGLALLGDHVGGSVHASEIRA